MLKSARLFFTPGVLCITAFLGLALLFSADGALAQIEVDPDEMITDVAADDVDSNCVDASCSVSADLTNRTLLASTNADASEAKEVEAILSAAFDVSAESGDPQDQTKLLGSMISLSVRADGVLTASGTDSSAGYRLDVQVVDASAGGTLVATQKIGESRVKDGIADVLVLEAVVLPVALTRGHSYKVELVLFLEAMGDATGYASADFASTAGWDSLTIAAGSDVFGAIADLSERVDTLETDVAELDERVDSLEIDVAELDERVDMLEEDLGELREDFENHTHEYLTGRGTGHNNTTATTTLPDFPEGNGVSSNPGSNDEGSGSNDEGSGSNDEGSGSNDEGVGSNDEGSTTSPPPVVVVDDDEEDDSGLGDVRDRVKRWLWR